MNRLLLFFLLIYSSLYAESKTATYEVDFSFIGKMGEVTMTKIIEDDNYIITVHASSVGVVASLTNNREEIYISQGKLDEGTFRPEVFVKVRLTDDEQKYTVYKFEHDAKKVLKEHLYIKEEREQSFDVKTMKVVYSSSIDEGFSSKYESVYADNDLISFIFNASSHLPKLKEGAVKKFYAVAVKTKESAIYLEKPYKNVEVDNVPQHAITEGKLFEIILKKDFFNDGEGKIEIALDDDGFPSVAVMNDVALFGDVVGKRVD